MHPLEEKLVSNKYQSLDFIQKITPVIMTFIQIILFLLLDWFEGNDIKRNCQEFYHLYRNKFIWVIYISKIILFNEIPTEYNLYIQKN